MKRFSIIRRLSAVLAVLSLVLMLFPAVPPTPVAASNRRVADPSTMDTWKQFYGPEATSTQYAGGVWMDKSVLTEATAFPQGTITMTDSENGFLVALSAIASNKEIRGYSTVPTDTVLVVDVSASMTPTAPTLTASLNATLKALLDSNYNNRVGVVLYAGADEGASSYVDSVTVLMPLDRYTAYNDVYITTDGLSLAVASTVKNGQGVSLRNGAGDIPKRLFGGDNYMQAGLYEALKQFEAADPLVTGDNVQDGVSRLPVLVLISDDAPNTATSCFDQVDRYDRSNAGDGRSESEEIRFLTQLTAAYVRNHMEAHYNRVGESLFYTLGIGENGNVFDPSRANETLQSLWTVYGELDGSTGLELHVPDADIAGHHKTITIYKNAHAVDKNYADEFFYAADGAELTKEMDAVTSEILLRSRYYPTDLEGGNPDLSGYIIFEETVGQYMEVKDIKGILLGDRLFSGKAMASMLNNSSEAGLGSVAVPSTLGLAFRDSVKTRLGLPDNTTAIDLISKAAAAGQLRYDAATGDFSNYIAWYADAAGVYVGFWDETETSSAPAGAVYAVRSYGFLGETGSGVRDSDMMYMTVQVRTKLDTDEQQVLWKIPAALVPMVTYKVSFDGASEAEATKVSLEREGAEPIRLVYEIGLDEAINEYNVGEVYEEKHVRPDDTRVFWTNAWKEGTNAADTRTATAHFVPSAQNERYYYTADTPIYQKQGDGYKMLTDAAYTVDVQAAYYRARYIFRQGSDRSQVLYEPISEESLSKAVWDEEQGVWIVPKGTVYRRQTDRYFEKDLNATGTAAFAYNLTVSMTNASYEAFTMLGNNGRLLVTPATGIKLTKTADFIDPTLSEECRFRLTVSDVFERPLDGTFPTLCAVQGEVDGEHGTITLQNGVAELTLSVGQTLYITELPFGARFTAEELPHEGYRTKSVTVNGVAVGGSAASGEVDLNTLTDVCFVNTPQLNGDLFLRRTISYPFDDSERSSHSPSELAVKLTKNGIPLSGKALTLLRESDETTVTTDSNGVVYVSLLSDASAVLRGLPADTVYTVTSAMARDSGFSQDDAASHGLTGTISATSNCEAVLALQYAPRAWSPADGEITVTVEKALEGREWQAGDCFTFVLEELHPETGAPEEIVHTFTVDDPRSPFAVFDLTDEVYEEVGTYHYRLSELVPSEDGGVTYDTVYRRFHIDVSDRDCDGYLELEHVSDVMNTSVTESDYGWSVKAAFCNRYTPHKGTTISIPVQKRVNGQLFPQSGFRFVLLDSLGRYTVHESTLTDQSGQAVFKIAYSADNVGTHRYRLAELSGSIPGMTYDMTQYEVEVTVRDRLDGTTEASYRIYAPDGQLLDAAPVFENTYAPQAAAMVFSGQKELAGRVHSADEFAFALYETDDTFETDGIAPLQTVTNDYDGGFLFDTLTYAEEGVHHYVIRECRGTVGGIDYDESEYTVTVTVQENNGVLTASADREEPIVFRNRYRAEATTVTPEGTVIFTGRDLKDGELSFVLYDEHGDVIESTGNVGSRFRFAPLVYEKTGVYRYTVREQQGTLGGITYDKAVYTVTVTVTDSGHGKLYAAVAYEKNGVEAVGLSFRNAYTAKPAAIDITVTKELTGRAMEEGEFLFVLIGGSSGRGLYAASNDADGVVRFEPLTVYEAGTYLLRVSEVNTGLEEVLYDETTFEITVVIEDDREGQLREASRTVRKLGTVVPEAVFINEYTGTTTAPAVTTTTTTASSASATSVTTSTTRAVSPQTGEGTASLLWLALLLASGLLWFAMVSIRRKPE